MVESMEKYPLVLVITCNNLSTGAACAAAHFPWALANKYQHTACSQLNVTKRQDSSLIHVENALATAQLYNLMLRLGPRDLLLQRPDLILDRLDLLLEHRLLPPGLI
jgi:hypothetical protein|eukprot:COSAG01_NODE_3833_length_5644_cov_7.948838_3_plen_107_part_00